MTYYTRYSLISLVLFVGVLQTVQTLLLLIGCGYLLKVRFFATKNLEPFSVDNGAGKSVPLSDDEANFLLEKCWFNHLIATFILCILIAMLLIADLQLVIGILKNNTGKCRIWRSVRLIRLAFAITLFVIGFQKTQLRPLIPIVTFEIMMDLCSLFIVQKFIVSDSTSKFDYQEEKRKSMPFNLENGPIKNKIVPPHSIIQLHM